LSVALRDAVDDKVDVIFLRDTRGHAPISRPSNGRERAVERDAIAEKKQAALASAGDCGGEEKECGDDGEETGFHFGKCVV
jgi:hypothetical protein